MPEDSAQVLGTVGFGARPPPCGNGAPAVHVPVGRAAEEEPLIETWYARAKTVADRLGAVEFASDGDLLFGAIRVAEGASAQDLRDAAREAYAAIFAVLDGSACRHPLRFWNYVPRINEEQPGGLERYREFNIGRQTAFLAAGRSAFAGAPAACAIGTREAPLAVHFLASRQAPRAVENPRQVSAYQYPADFGPRSPTFSRAAVAAPGGTPTLFISGTASIVGFESLHRTDAAAQTRETFANLRAVLGAANAATGAPGFALDALAYTVYIRHANDVVAIRAEVARELGALAPHPTAVQYVLADICRAELLVEIEATGHAAPASS